MKNIVILGSGGLASEVTGMIKRHNIINYFIEGYLDDRGCDAFLVNQKKYKYEGRYLGKVSDYKYDDQLLYVIAVGDPLVRKEIFHQTELPSTNFPNIIDSSAIIDDINNLGNGNIISAFCIVGFNAVIGDFNTLTAYTAISHDSVLGDFNFLSSAIICGNSNIGDQNLFGVGSSVIPGIRVGSRNRVQAGMVVDKNLSSDRTYFSYLNQKRNVKHIS